MAFLDNARSTQEMGWVRAVQEAVIAAQKDGDRGTIRTDLIAVGVRFKRLSMTWDEVDLIVPEHVLPKIYQLAEAYQGVQAHRTLHVDAKTPNEGHTRRAFFKNDEMTVIEIFTKPHTPPKNDEDVRRSRFRGHGSERTNHINAMGLDDA